MFSFFDVQVEKMSFKLIIAVYHKPTFIGQYLNWKSFSFEKKKNQFNFHPCRLHRALMICSDVTLQAKLRKNFSILLMNGNFDHVIEKMIARKLKDFTSPTSHTVKKCSAIFICPGWELFRSNMNV